MVTWLDMITCLHLATITTYPVTNENALFALHVCSWHWYKMYIHIHFGRIVWSAGIQWQWRTHLEELQMSVSHVTVKMSRLLNNRPIHEVHMCYNTQNRLTEQTGTLLWKTSVAWRERISWTQLIVYTSFSHSVGPSQGLWPHVYTAHSGALHRTNTLTEVPVWHLVRVKNPHPLYVLVSAQHSFAWLVEFWDFGGRNSGWFHHFVDWFLWLDVCFGRR